MNTGTLYPYDIIAPAVDYDRFNTLSVDERAAIDAAWNAQEDFTQGENALAVVDGSGSMYGAYSSPMPALVALSLGIYFGERNEGPFQNHFITFSEHPQLVEIKGRDIYEKANCCMSYNEVANTNIERVFRLVLNMALKHQLTQKQLPAKLYFISDMEFDICATNAEQTNFDHAKEMFAKHGYHLPQVVFWNVNSKRQQQPVTANEQGVTLVSGCSPRVFEMVMDGCLTPYQYMLHVLSNEGYQVIEA